MMVLYAVSKWTNVDRETPLPAECDLARLRPVTVGRPLLLFSNMICPDEENTQHGVLGSML